MANKLLLTILILLGLVFGVVAGQLLFDPQWSADLPQSQHASSQWLKLFEFLGFTIFMGLLKMLIVPIVFVSVVVGVTSVGNTAELGRLGFWTLVYYMGTMLIAVTIGLLFVNFLNPGAAIGEAQLSSAPIAFSSGQVDSDLIVEKGQAGILGVFSNLVSLMIPSNIVAAMSQGQTLAIIMFALFFGVITTLVGKQAEIVVSFMQALFAILMKMVDAVMWLAPVGVFALLAWTIARIGLGVFTESIGLYIVTALLGLAFHAFVVLPILVVVFAKTNPLMLAHQMRAALMAAFATDSSSATLPITLDSATERAGISKKVAGLVLPLGSTINMDGTALYEAVAVVFLAQAFNVPLGMTEMVIVAITATLAAVGAAGIPSAGLVTMVIVVQATNQSLIAANANATTIPIAAIGLIIGVDRIIDMCRTTVNVWGDAVGAKIIDSINA